MSATPELKPEVLVFLLDISTSREWHTFAILTNSIDAAVRDVVDPMRDVAGPGMTVRLDQKLCTVFGRRVHLVDERLGLRGIRANGVWFHGMPRGAHERELQFCRLPDGRVYGHGV